MDQEVSKGQTHRSLVHGGVYKINIMDINYMVVVLLIMQIELILKKLMLIK